MHTVTGVAGKSGPVVQLVRTPACHAGGRRFEPVLGRHNNFILRRLYAAHASVAQSVEHPLGKGEVSGSSPVGSSNTNELEPHFEVQAHL